MYTKAQINEMLKSKYPEQDYFVEDAVLEDLGFFYRDGPDFEWEYCNIKPEWVTVIDRDITITELGWSEIDEYFGYLYDAYLVSIDVEGQKY